MRLTIEQKDAARRILALTEAKQFALASLSGLSPSVISEMTNPNRDRDIQAETWRKFQAGLSTIVQEYKATKPNETQTHAELDRAMDDVLQKDEKSNVTGKDSFLQDPGGWIASNARNYVERLIDRQLDQYLDRRTAPLVTIMGGVQSGRSSAVRRLTDRAAEMGVGCEVVDMLDHPDLQAGGNWTADRMARWMLEQMGIEPPKAAFSKAEFGVEATQALMRGLEARTRRVRRSFIIIDSFDALARSAKEAEEEDLLARWIIGLRNTLPDTPPFERNTVVLVANGSAWSLDSVMSMGLSHARPLKAGAFTEDEVRSLFDAYDLGGEEHKEARGYAIAELDGQPFLTHALAAELAFGATMRDIRGMVATLEGDFGRHWRQMVRIVTRHCRDRTDPEAHARNLLRQALAFVDDQGGGDLKAADLKFLRSSGLIDGGEPFRISPFCRQAIAKLPD